jgi:hypothetical protein
MLEAAERADQLLDEGDMAGAETWHRILNAIERLQAKGPGGRGEGAAGYSVHSQPKVPAASRTTAQQAVAMLEPATARGVEAGRGRSSIGPNKGGRPYRTG